MLKLLIMTTGANDMDTNELENIIENVVIVQTSYRDVFIGVHDTALPAVSLMYAIQIDKSTRQAYSTLNISDITRRITINESDVYTVTYPDTATLKQYFRTVEYYVTQDIDPTVHIIDTLQ